MEITIIGWYGTETIGDRGILAGILKLLSESVGNHKINLGSLYPFFSNRTLNEDRLFWKEILDIEVDISIFDSKNIFELNRYIKRSDLVIMGGGPLMHIDPLFMVRYAFRRSKKLGKKTVLFGCGVGPLESEVHQSCLLDIVEDSDLIVLRDSVSIQNLKRIEELHKRKSKKPVFASLDPSVLACLNYLKAEKSKPGDYISINLRSFPSVYSKKPIGDRINNNLISFINSVGDKNKGTSIHLISMHYFHIGGDDREFLNSIKKRVVVKKLVVQDTPLSLLETMREYRNAKLCYGMRFHSVIFQTILNGNNYILDYTEPKIGKISGFLNDLDEQNFYNDRYINLQSETDFTKVLRNPLNRFKVSFRELDRKLDIYKEELRKLV